MLGTKLDHRHFRLVVTATTWARNYNVGRHFGTHTRHDNTNIKFCRILFGEDY